MQKEGWVHIMANKRNGTLYRTRHCEVQSTEAIQKIKQILTLTKI